MPSKEDNHEQRTARIDRMLKELADVQRMAAKLAKDVRVRTAAIAEELAAMKAAEQAAVKKKLGLPALRASGHKGDRIV